MPRYYRTVDYTTRDFRHTLEANDVGLELISSEEDGEVQEVAIRWWKVNENGRDTEIEAGTDEYRRLEEAWKALPGTDAID